MLTPSALPEKLRKVADELSNQYVVTWRADSLIHRTRRSFGENAWSHRSRAYASPGEMRRFPSRPAAARRDRRRRGDGVGAADSQRHQARVVERDGHGRRERVTELNEADFEVFEDGVKQDLVLLASAAADRARRAARYEQQHGGAAADGAGSAVGFARRLRPIDTMEVVAFNSQVDVVQPMTSDVAALEKAIRGTSVNGSTSLYNAIYVVVERAEAGTRARSTEENPAATLVVLSDGDDTSSMMP